MDGQANVGMDECINGGLLEVEYINECWVDIRMEGCSLDIG